MTIIIRAIDLVPVTFLKNSNIIKLNLMHMNFTFTM